MSRYRFAVPAVILSAATLLGVGSALALPATSALATPALATPAHTTPAGVAAVATAGAATAPGPVWPAPTGTPKGSLTGARLTAANKALVSYAYDQLFNHSNLAVIDRYFGPTYVQHNPTVGDGTEALRQLVEFIHGTYPQSHNAVQRVIAQGDLVLLQSHAVLVPGTPGQTIVDIFRVTDGRIVEHWDNLQDVATTTVSGHDQFSTLSAPRAGSPGTSTAASERLVKNYFRTVTAQHRTSAVRRFVAPGLIQHDPTLADGAAATGKYYAALFATNPRATFTVARVIAEGDLVAVHSHFRKNPSDLGESVVDIYRVEHGRIVEHWDNLQAVPATSANANTMF